MERDQRATHLRNGRDDRGRLADAMTFQNVRIEIIRIERMRRRDRMFLVIERLSGIEQCLGDRAVNQPGVEMAQPEMLREPPAERALAGRRRSVDGDDHEYSAPSPRIIGTKLGKLVAMNEVSSTPTGLSLASPMTRNAMAMR